MEDLAPPLFCHMVAWGVGRCFPLPYHVTLTRVGEWLLYLPWATKVELALMAQVWDS